MAKYGYFRNRDIYFHNGVLQSKYKFLNSISSIIIYYDGWCKRNIYYYRMIRKFKQGDSLYIINVNDLGTKYTEIIKQLELLYKLNMKLYVGYQEINLKGFFNEIKIEKEFNSRHLNGQLRERDILENVFYKYSIPLSEL